MRLSYSQVAELRTLVFHCLLTKGHDLPLHALGLFLWGGFPLNVRPTVSLKTKLTFPVVDQPIIFETPPVRKKPWKQNLKRSTQN